MVLTALAVPAAHRLAPEDGGADKLWLFAVPQAPLAVTGPGAGLGAAEGLGLGDFPMGTAVGVGVEVGARVGLGAGVGFEVGAAVGVGAGVGAAVGAAMGVGVEDGAGLGVSVKVGGTVGDGSPGKESVGEVLVVEVFGADPLDIEAKVVEPPLILQPVEKKQSVPRIQMPGTHRVARKVPMY